MQWNWNSDRSSFRAQLHDSMAAPQPYRLESRVFQNPAMSGPERTRSLPNRDLNLSDEHFVVKSLLDF
jgi:hypothetical protein